MTQTPLLEVQHLSKKIRGKTIVKDISFSIYPGEIFGFLGPNGAGKTTTIRMLVGLIKPTSGMVKIAGYNVQTQFIDAMKHLGCIVENPELYPYLTGWENLEYFSRMDRSITKERMLEVAKLVGLEKRVHDKVKTYSLGMRQRLGIGQALLGNPDVLILDEPTNGLDPSGIREMREFIQSLAREIKLSVLVSSHLLSEIQLLCDRVAIITNGEVVKLDTVRSLLDEQIYLQWNVEPVQKAATILSEKTTVQHISGNTLLTPYEEGLPEILNELLVKNNIQVKEMTKKLPTLEDLFLQLTEGGIR